MSDVSIDRALMELLRRPALPRRRGMPLRDERAGGELAERESGACDELLAVHDLAALREGRLPPRRIPRLARHVARCASCQILVAIIVAESTRVESTGTHARERRDPELRAAREDQR